MRHRALATALAAAITAGCATGPINAPPRVKQPSEAASVTIERQWSIVGAPATMFFVIKISASMAYSMVSAGRFRSIRMSTSSATTSASTHAGSASS